MHHDLNEKAIQNMLNQDKVHTERNTRFSNKADLRPIRAKDVRTRNQIDLNDMGGRATATFKGKQ